jgi:hypothetical protein
MEWKPYAVLAGIFIFIIFGVYAFRNKEAIMAEAFPDRFGKKAKKKGGKPRPTAKGGFKRRQSPE